VVFGLACCYPACFLTDRQTAMLGGRGGSSPRWLWYCDIQVDNLGAYAPFVGLALARYQRHSCWPRRASARSAGVRARSRSSSSVPPIASTAHTSSGAYSRK
jgi:hypothetical protein